MPAERAKQAIRTQLLILSPQEDEALLEEAGFSGVACSTQASALDDGGVRVMICDGSGAAAATAIRYSGAILAAWTLTPPCSLPL
jgi:hypothetical protein